MSVPDHAGLSALGILAEPSRRALYDFVAAQPDPVSREQAAEAVRLPVHSAKFHLDRLVEKGLVDVEYRRLTGRAGPGAGRPAKLYRRSEREVSVSVPPRSYDLVGAVLAQAIEQVNRTGGPLPEAVAQAAAQTGRHLVGDHPLPRARTPLRRVAEVLERIGYEPRVDESASQMLLANCPFDRLAREHTDLVCAMNLALVEGAIDALECPQVLARLEPSPSSCCVRAHADS